MRMGTGKGVGRGGVRGTYVQDVVMKATGETKVGVDIGYKATFPQKYVIF